MSIGPAGVVFNQKRQKVLPSKLLYRLLLVVSQQNTKGAFQRPSVCFLEGYGVGSYS